jgi:orotidine-5'-phosphate decarboxylase
VAYKPNSAFFEQFGAEGMTLLNDVISLIPDGIHVILDCKRGDIATTAQVDNLLIFSVMTLTLVPH